METQMKGSWAQLLWRTWDELKGLPLDTTPDARTCTKAFTYTPPESVRVVIIGERPYTEHGVADGMAFSAGLNKPPPSLRNIYKEIRDSGAGNIPTILRCGQGNLKPWATQGVLLLNASLTTEFNSDWTTLTDEVVIKLNDFAGPIVFMLWGHVAKAKGKLITSPRHKVLTAALPSRSAAHRGFFGCNHFNKANEVLAAAGKQPVDWGKIGDSVA